MLTKMLSGGTFLTVTALLSLNSLANAAVFSVGDTLVFQGGNPLLEKEGNLRLTNIKPGTLPSVLFVKNNVAAPVGKQSVQYTSPVGNTGVFSDFNMAPQATKFRSFGLNTWSGLRAGTRGNTFIELPATATFTKGAVLKLNLATAKFIGAPNSGLPIESDNLEEGEFTFKAEGILRDVATKQMVKILYNFTAQGLTTNPYISSRTDNGFFSDAKFVVTDIEIPEPSSTIGLLALGSFVAARTLKRKNLI